MHVTRKQLMSCVSGIILLSCAPGLAAAQDKPDDAITVIVTGTRTSGLKAVDSAAPVQLVDAASLKRVGQTDLAQALSQTVPSLTVQAFGGDMANNTLSARLRGISPNDTLVLINGKRRHGSASIAVLGGPYQGGAAADFSFLPVGSIDHIEVLTDGAAAQYGTDAIAGVVNVILKKSSGGTLTATTGQYFDEGGATADLSGSYGFTPTDKSFLNMSFVAKYHGYSDRGAIDPRVAPQTVLYPNLTTAPGYPHLNHIHGDGAQNLYTFAYNYGYDLNDEWQMYSFGTWGAKKSSSYENWRPPNRLPVMYPLGFNPHESSSETDHAYTFGMSGTLADWSVDLSTTYGKDDLQISNYGGGNVSLYNDTGATPSEFYIGAFIFGQWTGNLDISREFDFGMAGPLTLAMGIEARNESYEIKPGDAASTYKEGSQAFPGFELTDAGKNDRTNASIYIDAAFKPVEALSVDLAARFEEYSDFGSATVGKATARYDFSPGFAVRGTVSTGFRAPTMAEGFYSATNVSPTSAFVQLPPNSAAAKQLGINGLKPEKSTNYSLGFVAHPVPAMTLTVDAYQIEITDRIIATGSVYGKRNNVEVNPAVTAAILANGNELDSTVKDTGVNLFLNGADTTTKGAEFVMTYPSDFGSWGKVDWSFSGAYTETTVDRLLDASSVLPASILFDANAVAILETQNPKYRLIGGAYWTKGRWAVSLKETLNGESSSMDLGDDDVWYKSTIESALITDLDIAFKVGAGVKLSIGANNLFNSYPDKQNKDLLQSYFNAGDNSAVAQYPSYSPFGINGGYYYAKVSYAF